MRRECLWVGRTCGGPGQFQDEDGDLKVDAARAKDEPARAEPDFVHRGIGISIPIRGNESAAMVAH